MRSNVRRLMRGLLVLIALLSGVLTSTGARAQPFEVFTPAVRPFGVTTDLAGNVFVLFDETFSTGLAKFAPDGTLLSRRSFGGPTVGVFSTAHLATDPGTGLIVMFTQLGEIFLVDPITLQDLRLVDLRQFGILTDNNVFDVLLGFSRPMTLGLPNYADVAVRRLDETRFDVFVTGSTGAAGGFPFVMRVRINFATGAVEPDVIVTSQGTTVGDVGQRPGIAVNPQGLVLTTLPFPVRQPIAGFASGVVMFGADFPENPVAVVPQFIFVGPDGVPADFPSNGMASDPLGNFYVVTGVVGTSACGLNASGALVFVPITGAPPLCFTLSGVLIRTQDVAVSPRGDAVYLTDFSLNAVLRVPPVLGPVAPVPASGSPAP